jgi:hypothetical protein
MQSQIYRILSERSGKPLRQIIRDTKRTDFYLDAVKAKDYGLIDDVLGPADAALPAEDAAALAAAAAPTPVESRQAAHAGSTDSEPVERKPAAASASQRPASDS